jgi:glycosyltransferase involved in cell wall biosynthesis
MSEAEAETPRTASKAQTAAKESRAAQRVSVIIPALNEARSLAGLLPALKASGICDEIVVVDDGSTDDTDIVCAENEVRYVFHPYRMGNGAAVKSGVRAASGDILVLMDGDGQHRVEDIAALLARLHQGYDMVVGARNWSGQAGAHRGFANTVFNRFSSWMVGQRLQDLTSGFRVARADKFKRFLYLLPNGFSYPTTITMSFLRAGYPVGFEPVTVLARQGRSHIRPLRDGVRFLLIIFRIGALYSPLKIFAPFSAFFFLTGIAYYAYTFLVFHRFTNMSALLITTSVIVFLIGIVSEQITMLNYRDSER